MNKEAMEQFRLIFRTMSNPTRLTIVSFLKKHDGCCFGDIRQEFNANNNTISFHLKKLVDAGLVKKNGLYYITDFGKEVAIVYEDFERVIAEFDK